MCNGGIRGLAGPVTHHRVQPMGMSEADCLEGVGQCPDLVWLDEDAVRRASFNAFLDAVDLGNKDVVPAEQAPVADLAVELGKTVKVVFVERILDIDKVVFVDKPGDIRDLVLGRADAVAVLLPLACPHLARRNVDTHIDRDIHLVVYPGGCLGNELKCEGIVNLRCPCTLITLAGGNSPFL